MAVSEEEVRHVANLARLGLEPGRVAQLAHELNGILAHIDALSAADTSAVEGQGNETSRGMPLRTDGDDASTAERQVPQSARERMSPWTRDGFFLVPRLATHEDAGDSADGGVNGDSA